MADEMAPLRRDEIAQFAKSPRQVRFFEEMGKAVATSLPNTISAQPTSENSLVAAGSFLRRPEPHPLTADADAQRILAGQIFGA